MDLGQSVPNVAIELSDGSKKLLQDLWRDQVLVLYFYPKDETSGCTVQACTFRDQYQDFCDAGAEVIGISHDPVSSHQQFAANHRLPFLLVSDSDGTLHRLFGVKSIFGFVKGRVTFVIDNTGVVRFKFASRIFFEKHVHVALACVRKLVQEKYQNGKKKEA